MSFVVMLMLGSMDWMMMDWDSHNMRLNNDWIRYFDWNVNRIRHFDFLDDRDFNFLVDWEFLSVMMMNCVNLVRHFNFDVMTVKMEIKLMVNEAGNVELVLLSTSTSTAT